MAETSYAGYNMWWVRMGALRYFACGSSWTPPPLKRLIGSCHLAYTLGAAMVDYRVHPVPEHASRNAQHFQGLQFTWVRWQRPHEGWSHDHCHFCGACICDARDRYPFDKPGPVEGGHFRHAYRAGLPNETEVWACRTCFKALAPVGHWTRTGSRSIPAGGAASPLR